MQQDAIIKGRGDVLGGGLNEQGGNLLSGHLAVSSRLRSGALRDEAFDLIFPPFVRQHSDLHWSPLQCAVRAAELCAPEPGMKVLDVGAGPGKFCIAGALVTEGRFFGIEQRKSLVDVAREIAERHKIPRVQFECGNATDFDWSPFDSVYLYNPFSENLDECIRIDDSCELNRNLYLEYVEAVQAKLAHLVIGTRVVTLNGFGGELPPSYARLHSELTGSLPLELWIQC